MTDRLDRALTLRDHALRIVNAVGQVVTIGDKRHAILDAAPWRIALITPLEGAASSSIALSVWNVSKVLFVEWNAADPATIDVPNFRQSDWEQDFLAWSPCRS